MRTPSSCAVRDSSAFAIRCKIFSTFIPDVCIKKTGIFDINGHSPSSIDLDVFDLFEETFENFWIKISLVIVQCLPEPSIGVDDPAFRSNAAGSTPVPQKNEV